MSFLPNILAFSPWFSCEAHPLACRADACDQKNPQGCLYLMGVPMLLTDDSLGNALLEHRHQ